MAKRAAPTDRKQEILKNMITILRFEINEMQHAMITACSDYDLTDRDISRVSDALEDVLFSLEDPVLMNTEVQLGTWFGRPDGECQDLHFKSRSTLL